jgi:hypothetical protein
MSLRVSPLRACHLLTISFCSSVDVNMVESMCRPAEPLGRQDREGQCSVTVCPGAKVEGAENPGSRILGCFVGLEHCFIVMHIFHEIFHGILYFVMMWLQ